MIVHLSNPIATKRMWKRSIFKRSKAGFRISFFLGWFLNQGYKPCLLYNLSKTGKELMVSCHSKEDQLNVKLKTASFRILTWLEDSISYDDNHAPRWLGQYIFVHYLIGDYNLRIALVYNNTSFDKSTIQPSDVKVPLNVINTILYSYESIKFFCFSMMLKHLQLNYEFQRKTTITAFS